MLGRTPHSLRSLPPMPTPATPPDRSPRMDRERTSRLERNGRFATELAHDRARREPGQGARLAGEVRLVRVADLRGEGREREPTCPARQGEEALKAQDA